MRKDHVCDLNYRWRLRKFAVVTIDHQGCERTVDEAAPTFFRAIVRGAIGRKHQEYGAGVPLGMIGEPGRFNDFLCLLQLSLSQGATETLGQLPGEILVGELHGILHPEFASPVNQILCMSENVAEESISRAITRIGCINHYEKRNLLAGRTNLRGDFVRKDSSETHSSNHIRANGLNLQDFL